MKYKPIIMVERIGLMINPALIWAKKNCTLSPMPFPTMAVIII